MYLNMYTHLLIIASLEETFSLPLATTFSIRATSIDYMGVCMCGREN